MKKSFQCAIYVFALSLVIGSAFPQEVMHRGTSAGVEGNKVFELTLTGPTGKTIQPLLGVNIGPAPTGRVRENADLTEAYRQCGVNMVRTHDFGGPLDMSVMYPDRTRDPGDPRSYDFYASDQTWKTIVDGGFEPYLRIGDSFRNVRPPRNKMEMENWARAAVEVVSHYREGKWNGFRTPFRFVEIWNEPDNPHFWPKPHTQEEYFELYAETARAIKNRFPGLSVGGPGFSPFTALAPQGRKWLFNFLQYVKQHNVPMDFFSWHLYSNNVDEWENVCRFYRRELDNFGFQRTPVHVTEYNTAHRNLKENSPELLALRAGGRGAAILTTAWIVMQENGVAVATLYRGPDPDIRAPTFYGIFYADGRPKHTALAFALWKRLTNYPHQMGLKIEPIPTGKTLWTLAGRNDAGEIALLVTNPTPNAFRYRISGSGNEKRTWTILQVNDKSDHVQPLPMDGEIVTLERETIQFLTTSKQS